MIMMMHQSYWRALQPKQLAQDLANRGRHAEAIAAERDVIAREKARLLRNGGGRGITLAYSEMILGTIGRAAGDQVLACSHWQSAEARYARVDKMDKLVGFQKTLLASLQKTSLIARLVSRSAT